MSITPGEQRLVLDSDIQVWFTGFAHLWLLSKPADPDADLIERMAADLDAAWKACKDWDTQPRVAPVFRDLARIALAVVREHEAQS